MRSIRTLHVETGMHSLGGPAQVVYLMTGLRDRGHEAILVCPKGSSVSRHAAAAGLDVITVPLRTDLDLSFVLRLLRIIKRVKPDIVHLHSRRGADIMGGIAARLAHVPAVVLSRRIDNPVRRGLISYLKYGPLCDRIIAVSNGVAKALIKGGVDTAKITRVHSVADAKKYQKKGSEEKVRAEFGLDEDTNVIAVISQLIERKGHRFLFQGAPKILESFPKTAFLILGEGRLENDLRKLAASLGIEDKVIFAGFRNNIGELLSIVTVLVHPATMEGFANCALQAMAAEVPVVATAVGGMPESVQDGVNGILVPPRDVDALADAVTRLLGAPELRRTMGEAGRRMVEKQFSVDGMVEGVLAVYRDALDIEKERPTSHAETGESLPTSRIRARSRRALARPRRIACFHLNQVGDLIFSLPALYNLRMGFPEAHIASVARPPCRELLLLSGLVDQVIERPRRPFGSNLRVASHLRRERFDLAVVFSTSLGMASLALLSGAPVRAGFTHSKGKLFLTQHVAWSPPPSPQNNLRLVEAIGCPVVKTDYVRLIRPAGPDQEEARRILEAVGIGPDDQIAILAPGTSSRREVKSWSDAGFAEVADRLASEYGLKPVIVGSDSGTQICDLSKGTTDLTGKTSLSSLVAILDRARILIGVDSGVMHLAAAVGTPVVALFGPSDPAVTGPQGEGHQVVKADVHCAPCLKAECRIGRPCMEEITADMVFSAMASLLENAPIDSR